LRSKPRARKPLPQFHRLDRASSALEISNFIEK
jgi:hypothetical protein